jgi:hypothetical protein
MWGFRNLSEVAIKEAGTNLFGNSQKQVRRFLGCSSCGRKMSFAKEGEGKSIKALALILDMKKRTLEDSQIHSPKTVFSLKINSPLNDVILQEKCHMGQASFKLIMEILITALTCFFPAQSP